MVVDGLGRLRASNQAMEKLLGRRLDELATKRWLTTCVPPTGWAGVRRLLDAALRGEVTGGSLPLLSRDGRRLTTRAVISRELVGRSRAIVIVAEDIRDSVPPSLSPGDCWCVLSRSAPADVRGAVVRSLRFLDPSRDAAPFVGRTVTELLDELSAGGARRWVDEVLLERVAD
ncbi:MAG: PAS domain-containing protein, partial [Polyangiaceae bacterium]